MGGLARSRRVVLVVAFIFIDALAYLLFQLIDGRDRLVDLNPGPGDLPSGLSDAPAWPPIVILAIAGGAALAAWWRATDPATGSNATERIDELEHELAAEHERAKREHRRYQAERELNHTMSEQVQGMHTRLGALGEQRDLPTMILGVAMELVKADRGIMLSREDSDGDGGLDLIAAAGFERDPADSKLAQRFAGEVIAQGEVIRQSRSELDREETSGVDEEIDNLVAIPIYIRDNFDGIVVCANGQSIDHADEVLLALGDSAGNILENSRLHNELRSSYLATVRMLAEALEVKDPFLRGHSEEVSGLVRGMAGRLDLSEEQVEYLIFASLLHDIGKIGISERLLLKPGPLTDEEYEAVKLHPRIGYQLVSQLPLLKAVGPAILHHHERFDGTGYPAGLAGKNIPLEARVIAIIDAFSAMISERPYQDAVSEEDALAELKRCAGTHFDPDLVEVFLEEISSDGREGRETPTSLADALDEPSLNALRDEVDPMVGFDSFSLTDSLTLLRSHRYLREQLRERCEVAETRTDRIGPALIVVKIDNLEQVNDEFGYPTGDRMLRMVARNLERIATASSDVVARDSGSRFGLMAASMNLERSRNLAERVRSEVPDGLEVRVGYAAWERGCSEKFLRARAMAMLH